MKLNSLSPCLNNSETRSIIPSEIKILEAGPVTIKLAGHKHDKPKSATPLAIYIYEVKIISFGIS